MERLPPFRRRRKSLRQHFREGLEAGLKAEPEAFAATKPRTMMGLMVRQLVWEASHARCDAIKLVFAYVDEAKPLRTESETEDADDHSQGLSGPDSTDETKWDWDVVTGWDSSEREKNPEEQDAARVARAEAMPEELRERFIRAAEAIEQNEARAARLAAEGANRPDA